MTETEIEIIINDHVRRNNELLENLELKRVSAVDKRPIDHHFWANGQPEAALLAQQLYKLGFLVTAIARVTGDDSALWNVEASIEQAPLEAANIRTVERLTRLAAQFDVIYDGWGTSV